MTVNLRRSPSGKEVAIDEGAGQLGFQITQAEWYIDADSGNDANDGSSFALALKTLEGFTTLVNGGLFMQPTEVFIFGDHSTEFLVADIQMVPTATLLFSGMTATELLSGTVTLTTDADPSANQGYRITAAGEDFSTFEGKRLRTIGNSGTCWIAESNPDEAGIDTVRTTWLCATGPFSGRPVNLVGTGESFVIEDLNRIGGVNLRVLQGGGPALESLPLIATATVQFQDLEIFGDLFFISGNKFAVDSQNSTRLVRCKIAAILTGPGPIQAYACVYIQAIVGGSGLVAEFANSLVRSDSGIPGAQLATTEGTTFVSFLNSLFQEVSLGGLAGVELVVGKTGFFGIEEQAAIQLIQCRLLLQGKASLDPDFSGFMFGDIEAPYAIIVQGGGGASVTYEDLAFPPFLVGDTDDVRIGASEFDWGTLPAAPVNGAGMWEQE